MTSLKPEESNFFGLTISELNPLPGPDPFLSPADQVQQALGDQQGGRCLDSGHTAQPSVRQPMEQDSRLHQPNSLASKQMCMTDSVDQHYPQPPPVMPCRDSGPCMPSARLNATVFPAAVSGQNDGIVIGADASKLCRTDSLNQPPLKSNPSLLDAAAAAGTPSVCQNAEGRAKGLNKALNLTSVATPANLMEDQQLQSIQQIPSSTAKPSIKQLDVGQGPSLTQQQQGALNFVCIYVYVLFGVICNILFSTC